VKENIVLAGQNNSAWIRGSLDKALSFQWQGGFGSNPCFELQLG